MSTASRVVAAVNFMRDFRLGELVRSVIGDSTVAHIMLWLLVLGLMVAAAVFVLRSLRGRIDKDETDPSQLLSNFREMHHQGDLSDAEFRTIKTVLGAKLQQESKENSDKG